MNNAFENFIVVPNKLIKSKAKAKHIIYQLPNTTETKAIMGNSASSEKIVEAIRKGAMIVDVRTPGEFAAGHVKGAVNYPLDSLSSKLSALKQSNKPVVFCCASGNRSGQATSMAQGALEQEVVNGGPWTNVQNIMSEM